VDRRIRICSTGLATIVLATPAIAPETQSSPRAQRAHISSMIVCGRYGDERKSGMYRG
jgi:hypothetical protein